MKTTVIEIGYVLVKEGRSPVFMLNSVLMIPKVGIKPNLEEVQDVLVLAGRNITSVSKGVGQWALGQSQVGFLFWGLLMILKCGYFN